VGIVAQITFEVASLISFGMRLATSNSSIAEHVSKMDAMQFDKAAYVELLRKLLSVNKSSPFPLRRQPALCSRKPSPGERTWVQPASLGEFREGWPLGGLPQRISQPEFRFAPSAVTETS
jgi:hypothetical protein